MRHYGDSENTEIKTTKSGDVKKLYRRNSKQASTPEDTSVAIIEHANVYGEGVHTTTMPYPKLLI